MFIGVLLWWNYFPTDGVNDKTREFGIRCLYHGDDWCGFVTEPRSVVAYVPSWRDQATRSSCFSVVLPGAEVVMEAFRRLLHETRGTSRGIVLLVDGVVETIEMRKIP